jgi:aryl-alcohol dehydrogenase-like predicted oxidoreductase
MLEVRMPAPAPSANRLGLGLAALGRPGYINLGHGDDLAAGRDQGALRRHAHEVLSAAYAAGVRDFDAARSYGLAEQFLAEWLRAQNIAPDTVRVGSKWGYTYTADWQVQTQQHEVKEHSLANFQRQWPQTQALLGPWLKVYLVHSVTPDSPLLHDRALLERLARLRDEGLTPGLSLSGPQQGEVLDRALALEVDGQPVFGAVQATYNLLEPSAGPALAAAHGAGWQVVIKEALANGRLTDRGAQLSPALLERSRAHGAGPDAVALAAVLAQPFAQVVLSGAGTVSQLHSNLAARSVLLDRAALDDLFSSPEPPGRYWQTRSSLPWN